jgi:FkbM family methyltransferase
MPDGDGNPYYSEYDEELYILNAVAGIKGRFIDVGACDGVQYSNTRRLVELGWSGVMIEPGVSAFQKLLKNYENNPRVVLIHAALQPDPAIGPTQAVDVSGDYGLYPFWDNPETYSTSVPANLARFANTRQFSRRFLLPTFFWRDVPMLDICDVLSIDTEGSSGDLLQCFPFGTWTNPSSLPGFMPKVICVEHDDRVERLWPLVRPLGYELAMANKVNVIFVHEFAHRLTGVSR